MTFDHVAWNLAVSDFGSPNIYDLARQSDPSYGYATSASRGNHTAYDSPLTRGEYPRVPWSHDWTTTPNSPDIVWVRIDTPTIAPDGTNNRLFTVADVIPRPNENGENAS